MATKSFTLTSILVVAFVSVSADVDASQYRNLCDSISGVCEYGPPDSPLLRADVCWDGSQATLKSGECPSDSRAYHLDYGEVLDPTLGLVQGYIPLDWACDQPGICVDEPVPPQAAMIPICCDDGECFPMGDDGCPQGSAKLLCASGVSNTDGTITCFEGTEVPDP